MYGSSVTRPGKLYGPWAVLNCTTWLTCQDCPSMDAGARAGGLLVLPSPSGSRGRCWVMKVIIDQCRQ